MKLLILFVFIFISTVKIAFAQAPQGIPYQAIARNSSSGIITNHAISVRFTIHDSSSTGGAVYQETFSPTTNAVGLFNVNVGTGSVTIGTFSNINWGRTAKFIQVELDAAGGTSYVDMGTTQMMSVPYALFAQSTGTTGSDGAKMLLYKNHFNSVSSVAIDSTYFNSKFDDYEIELYNVTFTTSCHPYILFSTTNGSSYLTSASNYEGGIFAYSSAGTGGGGLGTGQINLTYNANAPTTTFGYSFTTSLHVFNVNNSNSKTITGFSMYRVSGGGYFNQDFINGSINSTSVLNAFIINISAGTFSGTIKIYGIH